MPDPGSDLLAYYSARAREYEAICDKPERQPDLNRLAFLLKDRLSGRRVFEVACGTGFWTERYAPVAERVFATDCSAEVLEIARSKSLPEGRVRFAQVDAFQLPQPPFACDAAVAGFWWSHIPKTRQLEFLTELHARLEPGAEVIFFDSRFVSGSNTPIHRADGDGNTYQLRTLRDGSTHEVLKNFSGREELLAAVPPRARDVELVELTHFWWLRYQLQ
jgi:demethylmenaquinone methyltransferase/2-methoxy-6-polyprenyl-1,4-benzoquinol methylase